MAKYKVKAGVHVDADGVKYSKGQIVESFDDLTTMFPEKFELVRADTFPDPLPTPGPKSPAELPPTEPPPATPSTPAPPAPPKKSKPKKVVDKEDFD